MIFLKNYKNCVLLFVWVCVSISTFCTFLTNDFAVFWAWARLVDMSEFEGWDALIENWEIKGILSRAIYYELYKCVCAITPDHAVAWIYWYKVIGWLQCNIVLIATIALLPKNVIKNKLSRVKLFLFLSSAIFASHYCAVFQPEFFSIFFFLLSGALFLRGTSVCKIFAGIVFSLVFYLKSPLLLMGGTLFFGIMMIQRKSFWSTVKDFIPFVVSAVSFWGVSIAFFAVCHPQELMDMWYASYYQHTLLHNPNIRNAVLSFVMNLLEYSFFSPVVCFSLFFLLYIIVTDCRKKDQWNKILMILLLYVFPAVYIVLSNCFFAYHYYLLVLPSLLVVFCYFERISKYFNIKLTSLLVGMMVISLLCNNPTCYGYISPIRLIAILLVFLLFQLCLKKWKLYIPVVMSISLFVYINALSSLSYSVQLGWQYIKYNEGINALNGHITGTPLGDENILFLDAGLGAYHFANKSELRQCYPLIIQRSYDGDQLSHTDFYKETESKILSYTGRYIVLDRNWFFKGGHSTIEKYIDDNYVISPIVVKHTSFPFSIYFSELESFSIGIFERKRNDNI